MTDRPVLFSCPECARLYCIVGSAGSLSEEYLSREVSVAAVLAGCVPYKVRCELCSYPRAGTAGTRRGRKGSAGL